MKKSTDSTYIKIILLLLFVVPAKAQNVNPKGEETCTGPVFSGREVSRRATITSRQIPGMTQEALDHDVHGRIVLEAVLCRTGRITDLRVVESLPYGMTEKALETVRQTKFTPAELNWHSVSQKIRFEFYFNDSGLHEIAAKDAEGQIVEAVEIVGNRRLQAKEIMDLILTRPGDLSSEQQMKKDLTAILASGYFDSLDTRIQTENGTRGGVVMVIQVHELPLISEVKFEGLKGVAESVLFDALSKKEIDLRAGRVYEPVKVRTAISVIREALESSGQKAVDVAVRTENLTASSVVLTFVISSR